MDRSKSIRLKKEVCDIEILKDGAEKYFVIVPMIKHDEIVEKLRGFGYTDKDYAYLGNMQYSVLHEDENYFEDTYGNRIIGKIDHGRVIFGGFGSTVEVSDNCFFGNEFKLNIRDNSIFRIGENTKINCKIAIYDNSLFECGEQCVFSSGCIFQLFDAKFISGYGLTMEKGCTIRMNHKSSVVIGNDCMLSYNVAVRTNDGHSIFDIRTQKNINSTDELCAQRNIKIGNHVWIGMDVILLYGTEISDGSIVGARSLVKANIPNNCIAAGAPARVIRKDVAWSRNNSATDIEECNGYIDYTEL